LSALRSGLGWKNRLQNETSGVDFLKFSSPFLCWMQKMDGQKVCSESSVDRMMKSFNSMNDYDWKIQKKKVLNGELGEIFYRFFLLGYRFVRLSFQ